MNSAECQNWIAWYDRMPRSESVLHVQGECSFPSPGYAVELRRHEAALPNNPSNLLLELIVHEPSSPTLEGLTVVPVRYREQTHIEYKTVTVRPSDVVLNIEEAF